MGNNFLDDGNNGCDYAPLKDIHRRKKNRKRRVILIIVVNLLLVGVGLCIFALFHHVLPRSIKIEDKYATYTTAATQTATPESAGATTQETGTTETEQSPAVGWGVDFADKFTNGDAVTTDNSYSSQDVSITVECFQNISDSGSLTYYVADIYLRNIDSFLTAFAQNTFGVGYTGWPVDIAAANNAILAVSGDYYGRGEDAGVVIRNGKPYRSDNGQNDVLLLYKDGSLETFSPDEFDMDAELAKGVWQGWSFGPMLLDNGEIMDKFNCTVNPKNPRCAVGYYEPGHYCFVLVDGRQPGYSDGLTTKEMSQFFKGLGCKAAYNMDGGQSAYMVFMGQVVNQPYEGGRPISDIIYIGEVKK